jgi:surface carbohydrate biosynthesis protein (TIGR04326 family)
MATIISDLPSPDALAVNGPVAWLNLKKAGYPMERCIRVEALRYLYLKDPLNTAEKKAIQQDRTRRLLVLGDIQSGTTDRMLRVLEHANAKLKIPYEVWIKPHPHNQIELEKYPNLKAIRKDLSLKELLPMIDVTLASVFTSAELDAYCSGLRVINYLDPYNLNFSNLRGIEGTKFVSTTEELDQALEQIESDEYNKGKPEDFFWIDPELPKWKALLG